MNLSKREKKKGENDDETTAKGAANCAEQTDAQKDERRKTKTNRQMTNDKWKTGAR